MNSSADGSRSRLRKGVGSRELNSSFRSDTWTSIGASFGRARPSACGVAIWRAQHMPPDVSPTIGSGPFIGTLRDGGLECVGVAELTLQASVNAEPFYLALGYHL